jgi:hypothetical protein
MRAPGKPIYKLSAKLQALIEILHQSGVLDRRSFRALADRLGIKYRTLQTCSVSGRVSAEIEKQLCAIGNFEDDEAAWCDSTIPDTIRLDIVPNYKGTDTPEEFRAMLQRRWRTDGGKFRAASERPTAIDRDVACHELSDCGQATSKDADLQIFLQADFGILTDAPNGVRYGFQRARLRVDIICPYGSTTTARFGRGEEKQLGSARLSARGTDKQPSWDILAADRKGVQVLEGELSTTDEPLFSLMDHREGTRIESTLSVNLYDACVCLDSAEVDLSPNKIAIIERICAMEIAKNCDETGRLDLSVHSLAIQEERR